MTPITVAPSVAFRTLVWLGLPPLGAGVGWLLQAIADWVAGLPAAPFQGPFELVASLPQPHAAIGGLAVGGGAGLVLAFLIHIDGLTVGVEGDRIRLKRGDVDREFRRESVRAVFVADGHLVLLGPDSGELAREKCDLDTNRLAAALSAHGFPWRDGDPYEHEYRRWVEDLPDLPASANALLKARARALQKGDSDDAAQLREELARLNVVVRDRNKRQFWRRTTASGGTEAD